MIAASSKIVGELLRAALPANALPLARGAATITPSDAFRNAIAARGLTPPAEIVPGRFIRFPGSDKGYRNSAGWCKLFEDGTGGIFGDFSSGMQETWRASRDRQLTPAECIAFAQQIAEAKREREAEEVNRREQAGVKAARAWKLAKSARSDHPYLQRKRVAPVTNLREAPVDSLSAVLGYRPQSRGERLEGRVLVVPVMVGGHLSTLELIDEAGRKSALAGGAKAAGYWSAQNLPEDDGSDTTLLVGEGVATALSAREATGHYSIAALCCGNLEAIARLMRDRFPKAAVVVLADLGNGEDAAAKAAHATGALLAKPDFGDIRPEGATDFNDLMRACGPKAVRDCIARATRVEGPQVRQEGASSATPSHTPDTALVVQPEAKVVRIVRADMIQLEPVEWLWKDYLAAGKLHIIAGAPGTGKTTLAMALGAIITSAGLWPDGSRAAVGSALIWSGEDSPADTLVPRLLASGADLGRVHFVGRVDDAEGNRPFDPARDFSALEREAVALPNLRLVIVDPIGSAIAGDSHKNSEVRRGLQPLVDFAERTRCAVVGISHFTKGSAGRDPTERVTGSLAFGALARVVLATANAGEEEPEGTRLLVRAKSNLGPDGGGFRYALSMVELEGCHKGIIASRVEWGQPIEGGAREILATAERDADPEERSDLDDAKAFLVNLLADGPMLSRKARAEAESAGHSWSTIRRAMKALGVKSEKEGMAGPWRWALPTEDAHVCQK